MAAVAASSARFHVYKVYLRLLGSHDGTRLSRDGITPDPVSCVLPFFVIFKTSIRQCRSSPASLVICGSGLGRSCVGSPCQICEVGLG